MEPSVPFAVVTLGATVLLKVITRDKERNHHLLINLLKFTIIQYLLVFHLVYYLADGKKTDMLNMINTAFITIFLFMILYADGFSVHTERKPNQDASNEVTDPHKVTLP